MKINNFKQNTVWKYAVLGAVVIQLSVLLIAICIAIVVPEKEESLPFTMTGVGDSEQKLSRQAELSDMSRMQPALPSVESLIRASRLEEGSAHIADMAFPAFAFTDTEVGMDALLHGDADVILESQVGVENMFPQIDFFGLSSDAKRIVIAFDISASVKSKVERAGLSMHAIREETLRNLQRLDLNAVFGLIQFARRYDVFRDHLVPATEEMKQSAERWLQQRFRVDGVSGSGWANAQPNGIEAVLRAAFSLDPQPDLLIIVSDGDFQRTHRSGRGGENVSWEELRRTTQQLQSSLDRRCQIHFIGFCVRNEHQHELRRWLRENDGSLILHDADKVF